MCLLDDVVLGVQAPLEEPLEEAAARFFFGGNHAPPDHEIAAVLLVL